MTRHGQSAGQGGAVSGLGADAQSAAECGQPVGHPLQASAIFCFFSWRCAAARCGLVTRGTRTRFLLVTGAAAAAAYQTAFFAAAARAGVAVGTVVTIGTAPVFTGILSMVTGTAGWPRRRPP
jgi:hypothetical protein